MFLIFMPLQLIASQCVIQDMDSLYKKADFVFEGEVISREKISDNENKICWDKGENCGSKIATLSVGEVWKGGLKDSTSVLSVDACYCLGTYFKVAEKKIVFAVKSDDSRFDMKDLGACATRPIDQALISILKRIQSGLPKPPEPTRIIVDATVVLSRAIEWQESSGYKTCGFENELRINEVLDGTTNASLTIETSEPLVPGNRYLFHLREYHSEHKADFFVDQTDTRSVDIQKKIYECATKLPLIKSDWPTPSLIVNLSEPILVTSWLQESDSAMAFEVKEIEFDAGPNKVEGDDLKRALLGEFYSKKTLYLWVDFRVWLKATLQGQTNKSLNTDTGDADAG